MTFARIYITSCTCKPCVRCNVELGVKALILEGLSLIYCDLDLNLYDLSGQSFCQIHTCKCVFSSILSA